MSAEKPTEQTKTKSPSHWLREQLEENLPTALVAVLLAVGVRWFVAEPRYIPSSSMEPTLQIDDRLIVEKLSYRFRKPQRGDIIVFYPPNDPAVPDSSKVYIKRVIGLPGDRLQITGGKVYVNGQPLTETYIQEAPNYELPAGDPSKCPACFRLPASAIQKNSFRVPEGAYWVMGDNRNNSLDSHAWGFLPEKNIVGRAMFRYWPLDGRVGSLDTPEVQQ